MNSAKFQSLLLVLMLAFGLTSCKKDDDPSPNTSQLQMEITDGPCDDPSVKAVFVTIAEVKVDGKTFNGFSGKKTINLLAYQKGEVAALGLGNLDAGAYQEITLVLDAQTDANGNAPGCYVETIDNVKHALSGAATVTVSTLKNITLVAGATTQVVLDFDLRKAVQYSGGGSADQYDFVTSASLQTALRAVVKTQSGNLQGSCQNAIVNTDKIVAYVYKKGTFNRNVELSSENGVAFKNAIASTSVESNGAFKIAFLESGDYEVHFAAYKDLNSDGKLDFQGTLILNSLIDLLDLQIGANANIQLNVSVVGILP
ncbi:MAG TPA: DUF4382 domain-containing protein [Saprospiraceae bacterium]|nr:DUF4382 domain-containing protein [Saprospiraceae bacterium]